MKQSQLHFRKQSTFAKVFSLALFFLTLACSDDGEKQEATAIIPELVLPEFGKCAPVTQVSNLTIENTAAGPKYHYISSGGAKIDIDPMFNVVAKYSGYANFNLEYWGNVNVDGTLKIGASHENLNGKHIKDRVGLRRTLVFPDGVKFTMIANGEQGQLLSISIFDGPMMHHINTVCNTIEYSASNLELTKAIDNSEADGETAIFELTTTGLLYSNIYTENVAGTKVQSAVKLGEIFLANPGQVNDYYDDPRLLATRPIRTN